MDQIKLATPEEIEVIAAESDLGPGCTVLSFGADKAVVRTAVEVDPVYCPSPKRKAWFLSHIETWLRLNGVPQYYFNITASETEWRETVKTWGAQEVSREPEFRYRKAL